MPETALDPAATAADLLRNVWTRTGEGPYGVLYRTPVDPVRIADTMEFQVYGTGLPKGVYGQVSRRPSAPALHPTSGGEPDQPIIYLNFEVPEEIQRFTCAHEIGHLLDPAAAGRQMVDYDVSLSSRATDPLEVWANRFAGALLLPEGNVRLLRREGLSVIQMAEAFGVTGQAVMVRLRELGLLSE
jgi:hypothetical protein